MSTVRRVRAVSALNVSSIPTASVLTHLEGKTGAPPAVTDLKATGQLFGIRLGWNFPLGAEDTQRTEIWYGASPSLEAATKLSDLAYPQRDYLLQGLLAGATFYFWARLVDRTGNIGPHYPTGIGVQGIACADAAPILDLIAGQIGETELGKELLDELGKIPGLQDQIDGLSNPIAYSPDDEYAKGAVVYQGDRLYQAKVDVAAAEDGSNAPPNAALWSDVGSLLMDACAVVGQISTINQKIEVIDEQLVAQSEKLDGVYLSVNPALAGDTEGFAGSNEVFVGVWTQYSAMLEGDVATGKLVQNVEASVNDTNANVQTVSKAVASLDERASAMWAVRLEVNAQGQYVAAGIGLGIENVNGVLQSQFLVSADRFAVVNGVDGALTSPFAVQGRQVFINNAVIKDLSLSFGKISDTLQSDDYIPGVQGWRMPKVGAWELNGTFADGRRSTFGNAAIRMYHANGVLGIDLAL
jgi:predicted phage tail protein